MDDFRTNEVGATVEDLDRCSPDYEGWEEIFDGRASAIDSILRYLGRRKKSEVWVLFSQTGLVFLGREVLVSGEAFGPFSQAICFMGIVALTFLSPAFHYLYHHAAGDNEDASNIERTQDPP